MLDLHPILSGFPAAFLTVLLVTEALRFTRWANQAEPIRCGALFSLFISTALSFFSGYQASDAAGDLPEAVGVVLSNHHLLGRFLFINSFLLVTFWWVARVAKYSRAFFHTLYYTFLLIQVVLGIAAGSAGGRLVFEHGVGVKSCVNCKLSNSSD
jgi:uncharacterized membrane protein